MFENGATVASEAASMLAHISAQVAQADYKSVEQFFQDAGNAEKIAALLPDIGMELYNDICVPSLTEAHFNNDRELYDFVEGLLHLIAQHVPTKTLLVELLCLLSTQSTHNVFISALKALQIVLLRHDKPKDFRFCFHTIVEYLITRPLPPFVHTGYDCEEAKLLEQQPEVAAVIELCNMLKFFYKPLLRQSLGKAEPDAVVKVHAVRDFLLSLLATPLGLLSISYEPDMQLTNSYVLHLVNTFSQDISATFANNPYRVLNDVEACTRFGTFDGKWRLDDKHYPLALHTLIPGVGVYYYTLYVGAQLPANAPKIYTHSHVFETSLYLIQALFKLKAPIYSQYGMTLLGKLLGMQALTGERFTSDRLELDIYFDLFKQLALFSVSSPQPSLRKLSLELFVKFLSTFEPDAAYALLSYFFAQNKSEEFFGVLIKCYKNAFSRYCAASVLPSVFTGDQFRRVILKSMDCLKDGPKTQILSIYGRLADVISCLTFFAKVDTENRTGFWDLVEHIEQSFIEPVEQAVAQYSVMLSSERNQAKTNYEEVLKRYKAADQDMDVEIANEDGRQKSGFYGQQEALQNIDRSINEMHLLQYQLAELKNILTANKAKRIL